MRKFSIKVLSLFLVIALVAGIFAVAPFTVAADTPDYVNGYCGADNLNDVQWYLFKDGSMAFFCSNQTGRIKSYEPDNGNPTAPWYVENPFAGINSSKIAVERGITEIGDYAFYIPIVYTFWLQTYNIDLPTSLTTIGNHVFENQNKLTKIAIPQKVTRIGEDTFKGTNLKEIDYYGDPGTLIWGLKAGEFTNQVTCHIRPEYSSIVSDLDRSYTGKNITFEANLDADQVHMDDGIERNIKAYMGTESDKIFCGAAPFVVVGTFSGKQKSVTHGNNGFVSAVKIRKDNVDEYYIHTNNYSRELKKANVNSTSGKVDSLGAVCESLRLQISYEYIGTNTVKMIYHLTNTDENNAVSGVQLGGTGDIKIGADDKAAIEPIDENSEQVGFSMTSNDEFDNDGSGHYATLGFIAKNVDDSAGSANFFYGPVNTTIESSATGAYKSILMPERIFTTNSNSHSSGEFNEKTDSGMSYYWNVGTIPAKTTMDYAVLFSVYGDDSTMEAETDASNFCNVYWKDYDGTDILVQKINKNDTHEYTGAPIVRPHDDQYDYAFSGWSDPVTDSDGNYIYTAQYTATSRKLFAGHALTLGGDIGVIFSLDLPVAGVKYDDVYKGKDNGGKDVTVKFSWYDKNGEYKMRTGALDYNDKTGLFDAKCYVAAAEMAYNIHAELYIDETKFTSETVKYEDDYSVREYGLKIINSTPGTYGAKHNELVDLAKKMLDYGAKSQVLFERTKNTDGTAIPFANQGVDYSMQAHQIVREEEPDMSTGLVTSGLRFCGTSVVFLSKTTLRMYYKVTDNTKFENLPNRNKFVKNGSYYYLQIEDIKAYDLDELQTFSIGGKEYYYSVFDYAVLLQEGTEAEIDLGTALYWYNQAAKAYFG